MAALKKGVALSFGLITASVSVYSALEAKSTGNKNACAGIKGKPAHDPILIKQVNRCSTCGDVPYEDIVKVREVPGGLVPLDTADIVAAKGGEQAIKAATTQMALNPHPAPEVEIALESGKALYTLVPDPGHETQYALLRHCVSSQPGLAFLVEWTPRSASSLFRCMVSQDVIMLSERVRPGQRKALPLITAQAPAPMLALAEQIMAMPGMVTDFDPVNYSDRYAAALADLVASKTVFAAAPATATPGAPAMPAGQQAAMDALAAMLGGAATAVTAPPAAVPVTA